MTHAVDHLRYYQQQAHAAVYESWRENNSVLINMATGLGKTELFCTVAHNWDGSLVGDEPWMKRVLVLAHRDELVQQARERMERITQEYIGIEQAEWKSGGERIIIGSVQSVYQQNRLERLGARGGFGLIIVDEAHHYVSPAFRRPLEYFHQSKLLGVTATPNRTDEQALGQLFDDVAFTFDIEDGVDAGYLTKPSGRDVEVKDIDISNVKANSDDLQVGQLDDAIVEACEGICAGLLQNFPDRCGPIFFPGKRSAYLACEILNREFPNSAVVVTEETPKDERRNIMRGLKAGDYQWLCNVQVATEGFDWPDANLVGIARPTKSRPLYCQMVGRGTRVLPGVVDDLPGEERSAERRAAIRASGKPSFVIANFVGNSGKHSLVTVQEALGGNYTPAEVKLAKKIEKANPGTDVLTTLHQARDELKLLAAQTKANVSTHVEAFDPFTVFGIKSSAEDDRKRRRFGSHPVTEGQHNALKGMGLKEEEIAAMDKAAASKFIGTAAIRRQHGLATYKQMKTLSKWGVTKTNVRFADAGKALTYLAQKGWGRRAVDPGILRQLVGM